MLKSLTTFFLFLVIFLPAKGQIDNEIINFDSLTFRQKLNKFFFNEHPPKIYTEPSTKKNTVYFQALGDTPWIGAGYSRRVINNSEYLLETGLSLGFTPKLFYNHDPEPKNLSYSHHTRLVLRPKKFISPTIAYSGVWFSGEFYKDKMFNYWPSPIVGVRLGNSNSFAINLNWCGYFYKEDFIKLQGSDKVQRGYYSKMLGLPSANLQFSF